MPFVKLETFETLMAPSIIAFPPTFKVPPECTCPKVLKSPCAFNCVTVVFNNKLSDTTILLASICLD